MRKNINKIKSIFILLIFVMVFNLSTINYIHASHFNDANNNTNREYIQKSFVEEEWFFRYVNGKKQKRLWSYTRGEWLTDWMWV